MKDYKYIWNGFYRGSGAGNARFCTVKYKRALLKFCNNIITSMRERKSF